MLYELAAESVAGRENLQNVVAVVSVVVQRDDTFRLRKKGHDRRTWPF